MLTIEPPFYFIKDTTVFRDHQDPDLFYFLPGPPKLAQSASGQAFTLYKYRRDLVDNPDTDPTHAKGGGLAMFEVEIAPPNLPALQGEVARQSGRSDARLVPVMFASADVHALIAHADGDKMISDLVETRPAPLLAPHHAAFALALTAEGATLFDKAARGGAVPVGVVYEMRLLGLTPSMHARVTMNYDQMYDSFSASLGFTYYVSAKLDLEIASLIEHDLIHIEITSFTDSADQDRQRQMVMSLVTARVQRDFFRNGLPPSEDSTAPSGPLGQMLAGLGGGSKVSSASALFVLKAKYEVVKEQRDFALVYDGRTTVELTHTCAGYLSTMTKDGPAPDIKEIDLTDPFFATLKVQVASVIDFTALADLRAASVNFSFADHRTGFLFSPTAAGPFGFEAALAHPGDDDYQYDIDYDFDPDAGAGLPRLSAGPFKSRNRVLVVDPLVHFRYRRVRFVLGPLDLARVPQLRIRARVPGDQEDADDLARAEFFLNGDAREHLWRVHLPSTALPIRILARTEWEDAQGQTHPGDESEVTGDAYVALGPYRGIMSIMLQPAADWSKVNQLVVELRYQYGDDLIDRRLDFTAAGRGVAQTVDIPLLDPQRRQYQWRQTFVNADGTSDGTDWATADYDVLVVGERKKTTADVRIVWVGSPGDVFGLRIDLWARTPSGDEQNLSVFMRAPGETEKMATLPLDADGRLNYRFEVRKVTAGGEDLVRSGEEQTTTLLVVQSV